MKLENVSVSFGINEIFNNVTFELKEGEHLFIVGVNGAGKSTLIKTILGEITPDNGRVIISPNEELSYLPQVIDEKEFIKEEKVLDYLLSARPIEEIKEEINKTYEEISANPSKESLLLKKVTKLLNKLDHLDEEKALDELFQIIDGMKIDESMLEKKMSELSGGQKSKIAFAKMLYSKSTIYLMDEPTNHLDKETKSYVMNYLKNSKETIIAVSHDEEFLNEVSTSILYIDKLTKEATKYNSSYEKFLKLKEEKEKTLEREAAKQQEEIDKYEAIVNKYKTSSGKRKRMAIDREKKLAKLLENKIEITPKYKEVKINMDINELGNKIPLSINDLYFKYSENSDIIIDNLSFDLYRGEKFLIVGENGIGKSTLLKLIMGKLLPTSGTIKIGSNMSVSYYSQEQEGLDENKSIIENFTDTNLTPGEVRSVLGRFLFYNDDVYKKVKVLSPGEKARCLLAKIYVSKANFLVLDEPTNHLDIQTQKVIARAFKDFKGTMLLVSHNTDFVEELNVERMLLLPEGRIYFYDKKIVDFYKEINTQK